MVHHEAAAASQYQAWHKAGYEGLGPVPHQKDWPEDDNVCDRHQEA